MHELSIIENIFKVVERSAQDNGLQKVGRVNLKVGKLQNVVPDLLHTAFAAVTKNTIADGAKLVFEVVPAKIKCRSCQKEFMVEEDHYFCPDCEKSEIDILQGKELMLVSLEGERFP